MNKNIIWGLILIAIGITLFVTTAGQGNRVIPAGIITTCLGVFRIIRGVLSPPTAQ